MEKYLSGWAKSCVEYYNNDVIIQKKTIHVKNILNRRYIRSNVTKCTKSNEKSFMNFGNNLKIT